MTTTTTTTTDIGKIRKRLTRAAWRSALDLSEADTITATAARAIARDLRRKRATIGATTNDILAVATSIASARRTAKPRASRKSANAAKRRHHFGRQVDHLGRYSGTVAAGPTIGERLQSWRDAEVDGAVGRCLRTYTRQSPTVADATAEFGAADCWLEKSMGWIDYSRRSKSRFGVEDAQYHVTVQRGWLRLPRWLRECDGLLTLAAIELPQERANETIYRARWARATSGDVVVDEGFIVQFQRAAAPGLGGRAYTSHGKTIGVARAVITRQLPEYLTAQTERERVRGVKIERLKQQITRKLESGRMNGYDVQVTLRDSDRAGNCPQGASAWIARHFRDRSSASVSEILAIDDQHDRALLACVAAVRRQTVTPE